MSIKSTQIAPKRCISVSRTIHTHEHARRINMAVEPVDVVQYIIFSGNGVELTHGIHVFIFIPLEDLDGFRV